MEVLNKITSDDLKMMGYKWAEQFVGDDWTDETKEILNGMFVNGFMAGAIQIRAIVQEFGNEKEAE